MPSSSTPDIQSQILNSQHPTPYPSTLNARHLTVADRSDSKTYSQLVRSLSPSAYSATASASGQSLELQQVQTPLSNPACSVFPPPFTSPQRAIMQQPQTFHTQKSTPAKYHAKATPTAKPLRPPETSLPRPFPTCLPPSSDLAIHPLRHALQNLRVKTFHRQNRLVSKPCDKISRDKRPGKGRPPCEMTRACRSPVKEDRHAL